MEKAQFKINIPIKKVTWYDTVKQVADRLHEPVPKWLGLLRGWDQKDIDSTYRSADKLAEDIGFEKAWYWHLKKINEN